MSGLAAPTSSERATHLNGIGNSHTLTQSPGHSAEAGDSHGHTIHSRSDAHAHGHAQFSSLGDGDSHQHGRSNGDCYSNRFGDRHSKSCRADAYFSADTAATGHGHSAATAAHGDAVAHGTAADQHAATLSLFYDKLISRRNSS